MKRKKLLSLVLTLALLTSLLPAAAIPALAAEPAQVNAGTWEELVYYAIGSDTKPVRVTLTADVTAPEGAKDIVVP